MEHKTEFLSVLLLSAGMMTANAAEVEVYRWVDENGEVHYSESLPPEFKDTGHDVLNERGIVTDEDQVLTPLPSEEVPEEEQPMELPRDASGMQRPTALYSEAELQARMDNFLMLRYESEQEILDAMNVEIKQLAYDRRLLTTTRNSMQEAYRGQISEAANKQRSGLQVEDSAYREIDKLQAELADNSTSLEGLTAREESIRGDFQKQLDRYRYLVEEWAEEPSGR